MKKNPGSACVIGSGIAGLAVAVRLANLGFQVTVHEANAYPGGKISVVAQDGYRFDAGPSLLTLPQLIDELFILSGLKPSDFFEYTRLPLTCKYFYEDGTIIEGFSNPKEFAKEIANKTNEPEKAIIKALQKSSGLYGLLSNLFMYRSLHHWKTWFNPQAFKAYRNLHKMDFFRSMDQANRTRFKDPRVVQLFNRYATYNGSDPFQTPATLNIIPHLEFNLGAYFPTKGMHGITEALYNLAKRKGVSFHFNQPVEQIMVEDGQAKAVFVNGKAEKYDKIVSNMDVVSTYRKLLQGHPSPERILKQPKSSSALIFYWGIKKQFGQLGLHNIFFSRDYKKEFDHIFSKSDISDDPTIYVNITSKYKPDDAPAGCENWFVMINVPHNAGQDWDGLIATARQDILKKMGRLLNQDISALIETESILDPRLIEARTSSSMGALYGNSSNNKFAAFLRHANFSGSIKNLYFCGGSVHPGGGIPLCLLSARIVADMIEKSR